MEGVWAQGLGGLLNQALEEAKHLVTFTVPVKEPLPPSTVSGCATTCMCAVAFVASAWIRAPVFLLMQVIAMS